MTRLTTFVSLLVASQVPIHVGAQNSTTKTVDLGYATYTTDVSLDDGVTSFLGIRYAAPPTGDLRFQAPHPPSNVSAILNATTQPAQCWSEDAFGFNTTSPYSQNLARRDTPPPPPVPTVSDEDCLFLNVHVPTALVPGRGAPLPVVVWIHGGGYDSGNVSLYPLQTFVHDSNYSLISVGIQYRLGAFGFLSGEEIKEGGALNSGLLDQQFALRWVQDHIASFGGDPSKVTIWGQSAGAGSVLQHIVAHGGKTNPPLFRAGIMSSPFLPFQFPYNDAEPEAIYSMLVDGVNCTSSTDTLACLRSIPADTLLSAQTTIVTANFLGTYTFVPVIDGALIVERPTETLRKGIVNGEALLVDTVAHEGDIFANADFLSTNNFTLPQYVAALFPRLDESQQAQVVDIYSNNSRFGTVPAQAAAVMGECKSLFMVMPEDVAFGSKGWKSEFAIPPALHGMDLGTVFSQNVTAFSRGEPLYTNPAFSLAFRTAFFSLAENLDPNAHPGVDTIAPAFSAWNATQEEVLFNKTEAGEPVVDVVNTDTGLSGRCALWEEFAGVNSQ
ncbi:alpha/beta-hydrolase [Amylostereum chailletii]|nr:alpha/beta-hydrolase [Amylostereum chailletii]